MFQTQHEHSLSKVYFLRGQLINILMVVPYICLNALKSVLWFNDWNVIYSIYQHFPGPLPAALEQNVQATVGTVFVWQGTEAILMTEAI